MLSWIRSWWSRPVTVEADPAPQVVLPRSIALATPVTDDPPTSLMTYLGVLKGDKKAVKSPKSHETV